ncbi:MAG: hypothetical protein IJT01_03000 [Selenomonadaceae bacterium]|nr:hypothetical protein [Selenomonadaceae bacterium]
MDNSWGGARKGAGRPKGTYKPGGTRKQRQLRAFDDEWELIKQFDKLIKHGDREACEKFLAKM